MAVLTRIQNNQITDNTIQAQSKLASGSITGNLLASTVTFNSNITILGNLTVANSFAQLNSINTYINDPVVVFNGGYTGSLTNYSIGILVNRNLASLSNYGAVNTFLGWSEAQQAFVAIATTETGTSVSSINNSGYANVIVGNVTASGILNSPISGSTGYFTTTYSQNFSSSNILITGGTLTGVTLASITGLSATNFSTANAQITGGSINGTIIGNTTPSSGAFTTASTTGNLTVGGNIAVTGNIIPSANVIYSLGTSTNRFKDLWLSGSTLYVGGFSFAEDANGNVNLTTGSGNRLSVVGTAANTVVTTGNIVSPYHLGNIVSQTATVAGNLYVGGNTIVIGNLTVQGIMTALQSQTLDVTDLNITVAKGAATAAAANGAGITVDTANATILYTNATDSWNLNKQLIGTNATFYGLNATIGNITTLQSTNFSSGNIAVSGGYATLTNVTATLGTFTNSSISNLLVGTENVTTSAVTNFSSGNTRITGGYADNYPIGANTAATGRFTTLTSTGTFIAGGNIVAASATASTNTTTGALVVIGGMGVSGNFNIGANVNIAGASIFNSNKTAGNDTIIKGKTDETLIWARPGALYDQVVIGNSATTATLVTGAKLIINTTDSILLPVGSSAQRPSNTGGTDTIGMFRYSVTGNGPEYYGPSGWTPLTTTTITVIADQQFTGTGSQVAFTLSTAQTTASCVVSVNGILQVPTLAYSVSGTTLTFTEAPLLGDIIDVRMLTTTSTVTNITSLNGFMQYSVDNNGAYVYTGSSSTAITTSWNANGAEVNSVANVTVSTASTPTVVDSFFANTYSSAEYTVTSTLQGTTIREILKVLVAHNGSTANVQMYGRTTTSGNTLTTFTGGFTGASFQLSATTTNNNTILRIKKDYQSI